MNRYYVLQTDKTGIIKIRSIGITYLITGLNHGTKYLVRAASRNPAGLSEYTEVKDFTTLSLKPPVSSGYSSSLICSVPSALIEMFLSGYYLLRIRL